MWAHENKSQSILFFIHPLRFNTVPTVHLMWRHDGKFLRTSEFWFLHKHTVGLLIFAQLPLFCKVLWNNFFLIRSYLTANLQWTRAKLPMFSSLKLRMTNASEEASRRADESVRCVGKFQLRVVHYGWKRNSVLEVKAQVCVWPVFAYRK